MINKLLNLAERKKSILFILLFCILVTVLAFISPLLGGSPLKPGPGFILWGIAPLFTAILLRIIGKDWSDAGFKPAFKRNKFWYIFIIIIPFILMILTLLAGKIFSILFVTNFKMIPYLKMVLPGIGVFFIFAILEEFGWRGYLAPKLTSIGINDFYGYAIIAIIWTTWHLPFIQELTWSYNSGSELLLTFIPRYYLYMFALSIFYGEIRKITGSVWPAVLMHAFTNAIQHPMDLKYISILPGKEFIASFSGLIMIILTAITGMGLYFWRKKQNHI